MNVWYHKSPKWWTNEMYWGYLQKLMWRSYLQKQKWPRPLYHKSLLQHDSPQRWNGKLRAHCIAWRQLYKLQTVLSRCLCCFKYRAGSYTGFCFFQASHQVSESSLQLLLLTLTRRHVVNLFSFRDYLKQFWVVDKEFSCCI